ncbi:hypothetical protein ACHAXN_003041 [Cyclotella atomus]
MSSPANHPATSPTSSSASVPYTSDQAEDRAASASPAAHDDKTRPHAPVAKTLNKQELKHSLSPSPTSDLIPNLLHSGKFPPPPRSPRHAHNMSHSPPLIMNESSFAMSPVYPAAPPGTPYSPRAVKTGLSLPSSGPSLSPGTAAGNYKLEHRPSPPPSLHEDEHYHTLLNEYQAKALAEEKTRVASLNEHESQYTTIEEYKHALARERRHSMSLVQELSYHKFNSKYTSCQIYSEAEINEEAKVNLLIKNMEGIIKSKDEDKVRTVMELEREEERMINVLMERLERVNREKGMLERQIYGAGGGGGLSSAGRGSGGVASRFESMEGLELVVPVPWGSNDVKQNDGQSDIAEGNDEEEDEDEGSQDILDDKFHDPEMEMELNNLLEKKGAEK